DLVRGVRACGLCHWFCGFDRHPFVLWPEAWRGGHAFADVPDSGDSDGARRRALAVRAQCAVSRCALRDAFSFAILDVCFACCVSKFTRAGAVALALRFESDGRRDRRFSMGADRTWPGADG